MNIFDIILAYFYNVVIASIKSVTINVQVRPAVILMVLICVLTKYLHNSVY